MTLKVRNQIFRIFFYFSIASVIISTASFIFLTLNKNIIALPAFRIPQILNIIPFATENQNATFISFFILGLYVPLVLFFIFRYFENTQSSEIIFFSAFLLSILCEVARFYTLCFGIWETFTNLLIFLGNIVLFGRILAPLSFVCASILSEREQQQDIERNYTLMIVTAFVFALIIPLNTAKISSAGQVFESFSFPLSEIKFLLIILAAVSFYIRSFKHKNRDYIPLALWTFLLYIGYLILISADNYLFMILGTLILFPGTFFYLKDLHKMYMWL